MKKRKQMVSYKGHPKDGPVRIIKPAYTASANVLAAKKRHEQERKNTLPAHYRKEYAEDMSHLRSISREEF